MTFADSGGDLSEEPTDAADDAAAAALEFSSRVSRTRFTDRSIRALKETAYAVVNDGKRLVGCDRLSVALKISGRTMVEAISGQEVVEQRSNLIRELTRLCKVADSIGRRPGLHREYRGQRCA